MPTSSLAYFDDSSSSDDDDTPQGEMFRRLLQNLSNPINLPDKE